MFLSACHFDGEPAALVAAGLPRPRLVEPLGEVQSVHIGDQVTT